MEGQPPRVGRLRTNSRWSVRNRPRIHLFTNYSSNKARPVTKGIGAPRRTCAPIVKFDNKDAAKAWYNAGQQEYGRTIGTKYADFPIIALECVEAK